MKTASRLSLLASLAAALGLALPAFAQDNPFAGMKGKVRDGQWEYKMQSEGMPGMPAGMKMPEMTFSHCLSAQDVEKGGFAQKDGKMPEGCAVKNMKHSGNTASWRMECTKDPKMVADVNMTFGDNSFTMKQDMKMDAGGQMMNMKNTMSGRYLGPCKK